MLDSTAAQLGCRISLYGRVYINDILPLNDICHYQSIIATLDKTAEILAEIG